MFVCVFFHQWIYVSSFSSMSYLRNSENCCYIQLGTIHPLQRNIYLSMVLCLFIWEQKEGGQENFYQIEILNLIHTLGSYSQLFRHIYSWMIQNMIWGKWKYHWLVNHPWKISNEPKIRGSMKSAFTTFDKLHVLREKLVELKNLLFTTKPVKNTILLDWNEQ